MTVLAEVPNVRMFGEDANSFADVARRVRGVSPMRMLAMHGFDGGKYSLGYTLGASGGGGGRGGGGGARGGSARGGGSRAGGAATAAAMAITRSGRGMASRAFRTALVSRTLHGLATDDDFDGPVVVGASFDSSSSPLAERMAQRAVSYGRDFSPYRPVVATGADALDLRARLRAGGAYQPAIPGNFSPRATPDNSIGDLGLPADPTGDVLARAQAQFDMLDRLQAKFAADPANAPPSYQTPTNVPDPSAAAPRLPTSPQITSETVSAPVAPKAKSIFENRWVMAGVFVAGAVALLALGRK